MPAREACARWLNIANRCDRSCAQGLVDIMLMSASSNYQLTIEERLFDATAITPAARANDASDVFAVRHGRYVAQPAQPFRTALLDHIQCGHVDCDETDRALGADLGLYSITLNNNLDNDLKTLEQYKLFREEAERKGFRHFLEVFDPNAPQGLAGDDTGRFINDIIARTLAGVAGPGRPVFLKIVYHGPRAMEELVAYDPHLVVGILGGGAGTTYDAFKLLSEAAEYGARAALFGRKINSSECQLAFIEFLRRIADGQISPEEAVRAYHSVLQKLNIKPLRSLADDMTLQTGVMSYGGSSSASVPADVSKEKTSAVGAAAGSCGCHDKSSSSADSTGHGHSASPAECHCQHPAGRKQRLSPFRPMELRQPQTPPSLMESRTSLRCRARRSWPITRPSAIASSVKCPFPSRDTKPQRDSLLVADGPCEDGRAISLWPAVRCGQTTALAHTTASPRLSGLPPRSRPRTITTRGSDSFAASC